MYKVLTNEQSIPVINSVLPVKVLLSGRSYRSNLSKTDLFLRMQKQSIVKAIQNSLTFRLQVLVAIFLFSGKALRAITESIVKSGTTGFLIVLPTNSPDVYQAAIKTIKENPDPAVLGLHLEGPFINPSRRGAHVRSYTS